jgi:hypothetical protein
MNDLITSIKTGEYELISSRIVQVLSSEKTILVFGKISIVFLFDEDEKKQESTIKVNTDEPNTIAFTMVNINMPSYGTTDFVQFGKLDDGKDLYISFRVHSLNDKKVRSLEYSLYKK